jgi:disabled family protein 2
MSESPVSPASPASPTSATSPSKVPTTSNNLNPKKFEGDGFVVKGKLIGADDLSIDRDEKICLDSMFKLKALARARGEHKQKIQLNLTMTAVKIVDDNTKVSILKINKFFLFI